jgi:hypothetical protein
MAGVASAAGASLAWAALPPQALRPRVLTSKRPAEKARIWRFMACLVFIFIGPRRRKSTVIAKYNTSFDTCKALPPGKAGVVDK